MEAGIYSVNEHKLDTKKQIRDQMREVMQRVDKRAKNVLACNEDCTSENEWKPGGTMIRISGKWASQW